MSRFLKTCMMVLLGLTMSLAVVIDAEARRGGSFGSRGSRTFDAPAPTRTAPQQAQPIQRSTTPQPAPNAAPSPGAAATAQAARPGLFGNSFGGNLMRGLLIGGLVGALMGYGFGGLVGMLGFLLQAGLIMLAIVVVMRLLANRRQQPAAAGQAPRLSGHGRAPEPMARNANHGLGGAGMAGFGSGGATSPARPMTTPIDLTDGDFQAFERLLGEIQVALGRRDMAVIRAHATPEVARFLAEDFAEAERQGLKTDISDVTLLQGDLSEAWREGRDDYATVAMRFSLREVTREVSTGRVVAGDPDQPTELTEIWTFVRHDGGAWKLSAIQEV